MKKTCSILLILLFIGLLSCKKDKAATATPERLYSTWIIGTDTFKTDKTYINTDIPDNYSLGYSGSANPDRELLGADSSFNINIDLHGRPLENDSFLIADPNHSPTIRLSFYSKDAAYYYTIMVQPNSTTYLYTTTVNGKLKMTLPPTLFTRLISNGSPLPQQYDTITTTIQGVFYQP